MFKISPIQDSTEQISVAKLCGAEYKPSAFAYAMRDADSNDLMGFSQFEITEDGGLLYDLRPAKGYDDFEAMFILGRSTMNFIDLCGTHTLTAANGAADEKLLRAIGFRPCDDGAMFCDMTGFFDGSHCSGNH
jgi:hypothetical protein